MIDDKWLYVSLLAFFWVGFGFGWALLQDAAFDRMGVSMSSRVLAFVIATLFGPLYIAVDLIGDFWRDRR